jgi:diguanylate cyclase (GGDEF)-like protein
MKSPAKPANEQARLNILHSLDILDSSPEERFDRLTRLARKLFDVPIALISLVDAERQWFKSSSGLDIKQTPRDISFCGHAILHDDILAVTDTSKDERFFDNPLVTEAPYIRFYAGCPLMMADGTKLGTLCLFDREPRNFDEDDYALLRDLAHMAEQEITALQRVTVDELTMLSNRRGFEALSQHALHLSRRLDRPACLLCFNLDYFKEINEQHGRTEGDRALTVFGNLLLEHFRESDVIGRLGGDDFAVLLTNTAKTESVEVLARFGQAVNRHNQSGQYTYSLDFSVGAVEYDAEMHHSIGELLQEADTLMYLNKMLQRKN